MICSPQICESWRESGASLQKFFACCWNLAKESPLESAILALLTWNTLPWMLLYSMHMLPFPAAINLLVFCCLGLFLYACQFVLAPWLLPLLLLAVLFPDSRLESLYYSVLTATHALYFWLLLALLVVWSYRMLTSKCNHQDKI